MLAPDNFPKVCDPISKDKIRTALTKASTDADRNVAGAGLDALNRLAQVDIPGDVNGDLQVDCGDMAVVRAAFGKETDQPGFDRRADVNVDGLVDSRDLLAVRQHLASGTQCADFSPPVIGGLPVASTCILWPPNKALVEVATVTGNDQFGLASFNVSVSSDEPSGSENPDTAVLGIGVGPRIVQLRADRLGNGNGRLYTITATATNVAGITATASSTCSVPHDQGR
jgi:hypothetical protein